jgi:nitrate reductase cytochrome c-type subunit
MTMSTRLIATLMTTLLFCGGITAALAEDEEVPTQQEVGQAENEPPVIPHKATGNETAKQCLKCHLKGTKGAPKTPHPERKACTQCHVPGA